MKVYLAGTSKDDLSRIKSKVNILESFAYMKKHTDDIDSLLRHNFLLDSGAFTFMSAKNKKIDFHAYTTEYINFINKHNIDHFFELDIYSVIGNKETEDLRARLVKETGKKPIPVWHIFLGIDYYKWMVENFDYISIGASGRNDSKWTRTNPEKLTKLVKYANQNNTKVHGLGYTVLKNLPKIPFYSVDSTTWLNGGKFGEFQKFNGLTIKKEQAGKHKKRVRTDKSLDLKYHNLQEWIKFQKYAEAKL